MYRKNEQSTSVYRNQTEWYGSANASAVILKSAPGIAFSAVFSKEILMKYWMPVHLSASLLVAAGRANWDGFAGVDNLWRAKNVPDWSPGKTTAAEVLEFLGPPLKMTVLPGGYAFMYESLDTRNSSWVSRFPFRSSTGLSLSWLRPTTITRSWFTSLTRNTGWSLRMMKTPDLIWATAYQSSRYSA